MRCDNKDLVKVHCTTLIERQLPALEMVVSCVSPKQQLYDLIPKRLLAKTNN